MRTKFGTLLLVLAIATATAAVSGCKKADTSAAAILGALSKGILRN